MGTPSQHQVTPGAFQLHASWRFTVRTKPPSHEMLYPYSPALSQIPPVTYCTLMQTVAFDAPSGLGTVYGPPIRSMQQPPSPLTVTPPNDAPVVLTHEPLLSVKPSRQVFTQG